jgi:hypothetical protein
MHNSDPGDQQAALYFCRALCMRRAHARLTHERRPEILQNIFMETALLGARPPAPACPAQLDREGNSRAGNFRLRAVRLNPTNERMNERTRTVVPRCFSLTNAYCAKTRVVAVTRVNHSKEAEAPRVSGRIWHLQSTLT